MNRNICFYEHKVLSCSEDISEILWDLGNSYLSLHLLWSNSSSQVSIMKQSPIKLLALQVYCTQTQSLTLRKVDFHAGLVRNWIAIDLTRHFNDVSPLSKWSVASLNANTGPIWVWSPHNFRICSPENAATHAGPARTCTSTKLMEGYKVVKAKLSVRVTRSLWSRMRSLESWHQRHKF